jgi:hypothetical protein
VSAAYQATGRAGHDGVPIIECLTLGAYQNGTASAKSPPHCANALITCGVMILDVASEIESISTSTGSSLVASALMRRTILVQVSCASGVVE